MMPVLYLILQWVSIAQEKHSEISTWKILSYPMFWRKEVSVQVWKLLVQSISSQYGIRSLATASLYVQGLNDPTVLPKNYFRDDALKLWDIVQEFVNSVLGLYYCCDEVYVSMFLISTFALILTRHDLQDVAKDEELQAFVKDVATEGLGWADGNTRGMAPEIKEFSELVIPYSRYWCYAICNSCPLGNDAVGLPRLPLLWYWNSKGIGIFAPIATYSMWTTTEAWTITNGHQTAD